MSELHAVILAGGRGLRLQELTDDVPKALLPIGPKPILEHIIYQLSLHGVTRVIIAGGYRFSDLQSRGFDKARYGMKVDLIDTGETTNTGGRIKALAAELDDEPFLLCWCDALSNFNFSAMLEQHKQSDALITIGAVHPPARFGDLTLHGQKVVSYAEKSPQIDRWISGGYFAVCPSVLPRIQDSSSSWEYDVLPEINRLDKLSAYQYSGPWQCMDTLHEHQLLNAIHDSGDAFWPLPTARPLP